MRSPIFPKPGAAAGAAITRLGLFLVILALVFSAGCGRRTARRPEKPPAAVTAPATAASETATQEASAPATAQDTPPSPKLVPGQAYQSPNQYEVKVFSGYVVHYTTRQRELNIKLRYPAGAPMPLPLVIFSHGGGPNNNGQNSYHEWAELLASAGYAVINIGHAEDAAGSHCQPLGIPADECEPDDLRTDVSAGGTLISLWYNRPLDASAVLDDLPGIEAASGVTFDRERMAAAGHSAGAQTVMSLAGALQDFSPSVKAVSLIDTRFKVFLANSPQGIGILGWSEHSWDAITAPVMVTTGANDVGGEEKGPGRQDSFKGMPAGDKYLLYIDSPAAKHGVFGLSIDEPASQLLLPYVEASALAFLDATLRGLPDAKGWLVSNQISLWSGGIAQITVK